MTLGEFYELLRSSHARGPLLEREMVKYTENAKNFLERNQDFKYMQGRMYFLTPAASNAYVIPRTDLKRIDTVGYLGGDNGIVPLIQINRRDLGASGVGPAKGWWVESGSLRLDYAADRGYILVAEGYFYSPWSKDEDFTHPLLDRYADVLLYQCLMSLSTHLRNQQSYLQYKAQRDEALHTAWTAEWDEEPAWMGYFGGTYGLYLPSSPTALMVGGLYNIPDVYGVGDFYAIGV